MATIASIGQTETTIKTLKLFMQNKYKIINKQKNDRPASNFSCFLSSKNSGNSKNYSSYEYCILRKSKMEQNFPDRDVFHIYLARSLLFHLSVEIITVFKLEKFHSADFFTILHMHSAFAAA